MQQMLHKAARAGYYPDFVRQLLGNFMEISQSETAGTHPDPIVPAKKSGYPLINLSATRS